MSEELEYILNKNDYYLKQRGLLKDNWNTNYSLRKNDAKKLIEKELNPYLENAKNQIKNQQINFEKEMK